MSAEGIRLTTRKVEALLKAPTPTPGTNLKKFLSLPIYRNFWIHSILLTTTLPQLFIDRTVKWNATCAPLWTSFETTFKLEWSDSLRKIKLVLNTTIQKSTHALPLRASIRIYRSTPLVPSLLKNPVSDLQPIRSMDCERKRINDRLNSATSALIQANQKRHDSMEFRKGQFVPMHPD